MTETAPPPLFDLFAPGLTDDPYPAYARMREQAPVYRHPFGFWLLTGYDDVAWLLRAAGMSVQEDSLPADYPMRRLRDEVYRDTGEQRGVPSMLDRDPPDHTRLRRLVSKAFTPRAIGALQPRIAALVDGMLDEAARRGTVDLVEALAFPLPFTVIADMLGTPPADHDRIRELTGTIVRGLEPASDPALMRAVAAANGQMRQIAGQMIAWKRANPGDDLLTALIRAEDDGDVLTDDELVAQMLLLYIAGHETTVSLIAGGTLALLRHPGQLALLAARPELTGNAVEEMLRYDSPVQTSRRITLQPVTVGGVTIPPGAFVLASLGSANRDPRFWGPDADELRIDRDNARQHVSFGAGHHHCLGAALARLEAAVAIGRLVGRFPGLALAGEPEWNGRFNLRGPARLPVSVR